MQIVKTKQGFILNDCGLKIRFTSYEVSMAYVYLYYNNVLIAIYENEEKFEKALAVAKGDDYQS
jgi:hypothetical protein